MTEALLPAPQPCPGPWLPVADAAFQRDAFRGFHSQNTIFPKEKKSICESHFREKSSGLEKFDFSLVHEQT